MSKHWARQEAKKNEIADALVKGRSWLQANRQQALAGLGGILVLVSLGAYFAYQKLVLERNAWRTLDYAQGLAYRGQMDQALIQLQALFERFHRTPASGFGALLTGDIYYQEKQFDKAVQSYRRITDPQSPASLMPFALSDEALTEESANDCPAAVETARRFLDQFKDHFLAPQTHASLARCLEAMGRREEATAALQQMTALYPEDQEPYWNHWAQSRLKSPS